jgi:BirA family biotin operon repressor/biotin-[acetyl-CoA-carboxylase] ligase
MAMSAPTGDRELEGALREQTRFRRLVHRAECNSTQDLAATDSDGDWAVFWSDHQTTGRGREGRAWHDEPGLDLAITFRASGVRLPNPIALPAAVPLCVLLAIESFAGRPLRLKWPNDVFLDGRKVAGVLIDSSGGGPDRFLVGTGVNVNRTRFPPELEHEATSLALATGHLVDRRLLLLDLAVRLDATFADLAAGHTDLLEELFRERLGLMQREVVVRARGSLHRGELHELDFDRLVLADGREFPLGLVRGLRPA